MDASHEERVLKFAQDALSPEERADFEAEMARDPALAAEVAALRGVKQAFASDRVDQGQKEEGWARLSRALDAETPPLQGANDNRIAAIVRSPWARAAGIAVASVLLWEAAVTPLLQPAGQPAYTPVSEISNAATAQVVFAPEATAADVAALLRDVKARVIEGPSALGVYRVAFADAATRDAAIALMAAHPSIVMTANAP